MKKFLVLLLTLVALCSHAQNMNVTLEFDYNPWPAASGLGFKFYVSPENVSPPETWPVLYNVLASALPAPVVDGDTAHFRFNMDVPIESKWFTISAYDETGDSILAVPVTFDCGIPPVGTQFIPCGPPGPCLVEAFATPGLVQIEMSWTQIPGGLQFEWDAVPGRLYELQFTRDLQNPVWIADSKFTMPSGYGSNHILSQTRIYPCDNRFFRLMTTP